MSRSTVSNVLHGRTSVAPGLRTRVHRAIDDLGYRPSAVARALALQRSRQLGAVIPDLGNPFFADLVRGAEEQATRDGYLLLIASVEVRRGRERETIEALLDRRPDGLLLGVSPDEAAFLEQINVPVVIVDSRADGGAAAVAVDHELGARLAVRHLVRARAPADRGRDRDRRQRAQRADRRLPGRPARGRDRPRPGARAARRAAAGRPRAGAAPGRLATAVTRLGATAVVVRRRPRRRRHDRLARGARGARAARRLGGRVRRHRPRRRRPHRPHDRPPAAPARSARWPLDAGPAARRATTTGRAPTLLEPELVVRTHDGAAGAGVSAVAETAGQAEAGELARSGVDDAWRQLKRDRVALVAGGFLVLVVVAAIFGAPLAEHLTGHPPEHSSTSRRSAPTACRSGRGRAGYADDGVHADPNAPVLHPRRRPARPRRPRAAAVRRPGLARGRRSPRPCWRCSSGWCSAWPRAGPGAGRTP